MTTGFDLLATERARHEKRLRQLRRQERWMYAAVAGAVLLALFLEPIVVWLR